ncbi:MAG: acetate--CoA ligase family protein [Elusimicrobia bacterium]|nr:acetate--CoA ligase family protein [Elusimicrobiota bacterium]
MKERRDPAVINKPAALDFLFKPKSVAVIGASNRPLTIGYRILRNLSESGYKGAVYPVHPAEDTVGGLKAYKSILDVPGGVDVAHVVVKSALVPAALEECGRNSVRSVIVNTAGFSETGGEGLALEKKIIKIAAKAKMRLFGPNCQGIMNSDPLVRAYCNFTYTKLQRGGISVAAQSGGVGEVLIQRLNTLGAGFRMYASNGNAADISIPEIMSYWADDEETKVILIHLESLADPEEFMEIASRVGRKKPVLALRTGRTAEGSRAVVSHTGRLMGSGVPLELMLEKCGVVSFRDQDELCQAAVAFASQPLPKGKRVAIVTNTGGHGIIAADACVEAGLLVPPLPDRTREALKAGLFPEAAAGNPVDVLATATPAHYGLALGELMKDGGADSVLVTFITPFFVDCEGVAREIVKACAGKEKTVAAVIMTDKARQAKTLEIVKESGIPVYDFPETAAKALGAMARLAEYRARSGETFEPFDVDKAAARAVVTAARKAKRAVLGARECAIILDSYGIPRAPAANCANLEDCLSAAGKLGFPVVLKIDSASVIHKTEAGGVVLNIKDKKELAAKFKGMKSLAPRPRFLVQKQLPAGIEIIAGARAVPGAGHVIMFGLGGVFVEVLKDVVFQFAPLSEQAARRMVASIKSHAILEGFRGKAGADTEKLAEILVKLSQLVADLPEITELDLNPVFAYQDPSKTAAVDVRINLNLSTVHRNIP